MDGFNAAMVLGIAGYHPAILLSTTRTMAGLLLGRTNPHVVTGTSFRSQMRAASAGNRLAFRTFSAAR
jgi:hypothetical protein